MIRATRKLLTLIAVLAFFAPGAFAQGIEVKKDAVVLFGATATCTKPASIDFKKVRKNTPEWKTIRSEGVKKGSARYSLLVSDMKKRIKKHCKKVAQDNGNDCVVRKGDISDAKGLDVDDLTKSVIKLLESEDDDS